MKVWYLAILVYGAMIERSPEPMTAEDCALQAAYAIIQVERFAASGRPVPEKYGGANVTLDDVEIKCIRER